MNRLVGQVMQMLAVNLVAEPIVTAVSNVAVIVNAWLAAKMLGEKITMMDLLAIALMILGACLVVVCTPQPAFRDLSLAGLQELFSSSPLPTVGLVGTTFLASLVLPRAMLTCIRPSRYGGGSGGGVAFGLLAGYAGATSITCVKLCWLIFDHYTWPAFGMGAPWAISFGGLFGEIGMAVALFLGMQFHEAAVVVPTYYISMTVVGAVQGIFTMHTVLDLDLVYGSLFVVGILLCVVAVMWMAVMRRRRGGGARGGGGDGVAQQQQQTTMTAAAARLLARADESASEASYHVAIESGGSVAVVPQSAAPARA